MPSLDGYSLNEEMQKIRTELKEELLTLRNEFTDLYAYMKKKDATKKVVKKKAKKVSEVTESVE